MLENKSLSSRFPKIIEEWGTNPLKGGNSKKLSLCMIVKNEEKFLPQCLESVKGLVDEMIVVDTGSSDKTIELAEKQGAKVFHYSWNSNFAEARNFSLDQASGDWVLVLDADEVLAPDDKEVVRKLIQRDDMSGFMVRIQNLMDENKHPDYLEHFYVRIFPCHPDIRYVGAIHEQVMHRIKRPDGGFVFLPIDRTLTMVTIFHYGYEGRVFQEKNKSVRNKTILREILSKDRQNGFHHFNMGIMHLMDQEWEDGVREFVEAKKWVNPNISYYPMISICGANALIALGRIDEAIVWGKEAVELLPDMSDGHHTLGTAYEAAELYEEALEEYHKALECGEKQATYVIHDTATESWKPYNQIGVVCMKLKRHDEAVEAFEKAVDGKPGNLGVMQNLLNAYLASNLYSKAREILLEMYAVDPSLEAFWVVIEHYRRKKEHHEMFLLAEAFAGAETSIKSDSDCSGKSSPLEIWQKMGALFLQEEQFDLAQKAFKKELQVEKTPAVFNSLGVVLLKMGKPEESLFYFDQALNQQADYRESVLNKAQTLIHLGRLVEAYSVLENFKEGPYYALALKLKAQAAFGGFSPEESCSILERLCSQISDNPYLFFYWGSVLMKIGDHQKAVEAFSKALTLNPAMLEARAGLMGAETLLALKV
jgi:tetratricopeptide (TPR) repeat protein